MLKISLIALALVGLTVSANAAAPSKTDKACTLYLQAQSGGAGASVMKQYKTTYVESAEKCFTQALHLASEEGEKNGLEVFTKSFSKKTEQNRWKKFVSWEFSDSLVRTTSGSVSPSTASCFIQFDYETFEGDLRFGQNCEKF